MGALLLTWITKLLVGLFFFGLIGSSIVIIITFFEDGLLLMEREEKREQYPVESQIPGRTSPVARETF